MGECFNTATRTYYSNHININNNPKNLTNIVSLPYNENLTPIIPLFKLLNINIVFTFKNSIKNLLIKNSPTIDGNLIYKIPCGFCNKSYIGQTSKPLVTRINQHKYNVRRLNENSAIFKHISDESHQIDWNHTTKILGSNDVTKRNILESAIIKLTWNDNFNINSGRYGFDDIMLAFFMKELKKIIN